MFILHAKSPIVHIGHLEIKANYVGLWKGRCSYESTLLLHRHNKIFFAQGYRSERAADGIAFLGLASHEGFLEAQRNIEVNKV